MIRKTKSEQFIFVTNKIGSAHYLFNDLYSDERTVILNGFLKDIRNPILKGIRKVHLSKKINSKVNLPFKKIWRSSLREINWDHKNKYYVILYCKEIDCMILCYFIRFIIVADRLYFFTKNKKRI